MDIERLFHFPDFSAENIDVSDEDFLQEGELPQNKKVKTVVCPHCGEAFEI